jgi:tetratricopeptide (TPR) repeat protein
MDRFLIRIGMSAALVLILTALSFVIPAGAQTERPPEYRELVRAMRIQELSARLKELERIKAAYPESQYRLMIDNMIVGVKVEMADKLETILDLQKSVLESSQSIQRPLYYFTYSLDILQHQNLAKFDKKKVTQAVEQYKAEAYKAASDPEFLKTSPPQQQAFLKSNLPNFYIALAMAYLNEGKPERALQALEDFGKNEGRPEKMYYYTLGRTLAKLGRDKEALEAYFEAAVENYEDAYVKAKELWEKVHKSSEGFSDKLEARQRELPFHPEPFRPEKGAWQGKTVLAELFTGSECLPCVAADLGFDGLIESYEPQHLAVLVYHLPIPRPDPMTNKASRGRALFYGVNSTPTTFFDGEKKGGGGGQRPMAQEKYKEYVAAINEHILAAPEVKLKVSARITGDSVQVKFSSDKELPGADYHIALVQKEEKYLGSNGLYFHKLVVRDFVTLDAATAKAGSTRFSIMQAEADAEARLDEIENERAFTFTEKHSRIDRDNLSVVFFLQNSESKTVYNAAVAPVVK